jgi:hypothetical protein
MKKQYGDFSKLVQSTTTQAHGVMSKAFVDAAKGQGSALELMKEQFLEMIGTQMIQTGIYHLLAGIWPPNPIELGEGAALVAAGSALVGAGGSGAAGSASSGASGFGGGYASSIASPQQASAQQTQQKAAQIVINGDFLNSSETANHLTDILRQNSDITNYTLTAQGKSYN